MLADRKLGDHLGNFLDRDLAEAENSGDMVQPQRRWKENVGFSLEKFG